VTESRFWLYQWLDSYLVTSVERAMTLLKEPGPRAALKEIAEEASQAPLTSMPESGPSIIAGGDLDLSGNIGCISFRCRRVQVDTLFSHVWHYFDTVAVVGSSPRLFLERLDDPQRGEVPLMETLEHHIRLLLYIRNIGAEDLLVFVDKAPKESVDWREQAREVGLAGSLKIAEDLVRQLTREAKIDFTAHEDHLHYELRHPALRRRFIGTVPYRKPTVSAKRRAADYAVGYCMTQLISDIRTARSMSLPLGIDYPIYERMLERAAKAQAPTEADVAFHLKLPVLDGVEPELLLKIRRDESEHFEAFRDSLRGAIRERLDGQKTGDPQKIAKEVKREIIDPALNDIERRLMEARKVLVSKLG
jgi:hypothetical protein